MSGGKTIVQWIFRRLPSAIVLPICAASAAAVTLTSFSPTSGQPGTLVTITGTGFSAATSVGFNNFTPTLAAFMINSATQLTAVVPLGATTGPLTVNGVASSGTFTVAPAITTFSPSSGAASTVVYITGANFVTNNTTVTFTGCAPANATVNATTSLGVTIPSGVVNGPITVTTTAGSAVSTSNFIASTAPVITSFSPTVGTNGTSVTIFGGNFFGTPTVKFNGTAATPSVPSTDEMVVNVPSGATTGPIFVSTSDGSFTTSSNFITQAGPIITSFSPTVGTIGTTVTNFGFNLSTVTNVTINGVKETISGYSSTYLEVGISAASGTGPVTVKSPQGSFTTTSNFSSSSGPVIASFSPTMGGPGVYVVIDGLDFTDASSVKFNNTSASFTVTASTEIIATVPSGASTGPISVTTSGVTFDTSTNFEVTSSDPVITSFSPANGAPGTTVTITGANFTNVSSVHFNGVAASFSTPTSSTQLTVDVPATATSGLITVTCASGTGTSPSLFYMQPWITNATASGIVNSSLVLSGLSLTNTSSVVVGGVNYPSFTNSPTQIVATVPSNAVTGAITITAPGGVFISGTTFVVLPKIYSFTPTLGPAGSVVTIGGTSLFDVTSVEFNGVSTTPYNVTTNQLQANVPTGARPGPITVVTAGGNDVSTEYFHGHLFQHGQSVEDGQPGHCRPRHQRHLHPSGDKHRPLDGDFGDGDGQHSGGSQFSLGHNQPWNNRLYQ